MSCSTMKSQNFSTPVASLTSSALKLQDMQALDEPARKEATTDSSQNVVRGQSASVSHSGVERAEMNA